MKCRICKKKLKKNSVLSIENMPPSAQGFTKKKSLNNNPVSYHFALCSNCKIPQILNKPVSYYKKTIRSAGISQTLSELRHRQFKKFISNHDLRNKKILEIGCNLGENIKILKKFNSRVYGTEYNQKSFKFCNNNKLKVFKISLSNNKNCIPFKPYDAFLILNFIEHVPDLKYFFSSLKLNLNKKFVGIIEVPNFNMILKKNLFSEIIIDHLYYFTKKNLKYILNYYGFEVIKIKSIFNDYILSATVKPKEKAFKTKNNSKKFKLKIISSSFKELGIKLDSFKKKINYKKFIIWGAGHQSLCVISKFKLKNNIKYIVDSDINKQNKFSPGSNIKIFSPTKLINEKKVVNILIIAGGYSPEIAKLIKKRFKKFNIFMFNKNKIYNYWFKNCFKAIKKGG